MFEWADGAIGTVYMSTVEAGQRRMEIAGTGGTLLLGERDIVFEASSLNCSNTLPPIPIPLAARNR